MRISGSVAAVLGWSCILLVSTAACAEDAVMPTRPGPPPKSLDDNKSLDRIFRSGAGGLPKLKTVVGIPIFTQTLGCNVELWRLAKFGRVISHKGDFSILLYGLQMRTKRGQVLIEKVEYSFEQGRIGRTDMYVETRQQVSKLFVGKKKANALADLHGIFDVIASCGKKVGIRKTLGGTPEALEATFPDWKAYGQCLLVDKSLLATCLPTGKTWARMARGAGENSSLKVGGIPMGPGATLDEILRRGFGMHQGEDFKVILTGPAITFQKTKLKISHLEYTFPSRGYPLMLAVVESGKNNSPADLVAFYEHVKRQGASPAERTKPGARETLASFGGKSGKRFRCLLTTRKTSDGKEVASRLEFAYPGKWTLDRSASEIAKEAKTTEEIVNTGKWKRVDRQWVFVKKSWIEVDERFVYKESAIDSILVMSLNTIEGTPAARDRRLPTTVDLLIKVLASKRWNIRYRAILILGKGGPEVSRAAIPALQKAMKDTDPYVRKAATVALEKIMKKTSLKVTTRPK